MMSGDELARFTTIMLRQEDRTVKPRETDVVVLDVTTELVDDVEELAKALEIQFVVR